ncbi:MAG: hypothetical protein GXO76_03890 [Calditrichaeota bacterium]|nr:hypothetical protein [Calditrichota bacterium]
MRNRGLVMGLILLMAALVVFSCQSKKEAAKETAKAPQKDLLAAIKDFHKVLRPLQHEAYPADNAQAIRDSLDHLLSLGDSLEIVPVPKDWEDMSDTLKTLTQKLAESGKKLRETAKSGDDKKLLDAFENYHDHFESIIMALREKGKLKAEDHEHEGEKEGEKEK